MKLSANRALHRGRGLETVINTLDEEFSYVFFMPSSYLPNISSGSVGVGEEIRKCAESSEPSPCSEGSVQMGLADVSYTGAIKSRNKNKTFEVRHPGMVCTLICAINM